MNIRLYFIVSCCCVAFLVTDGKGASGADRISFGLKSGVGLSTEGADPAKFGVFMNYAVTKKMTFVVEFRNSILPLLSNLKREDSNVFESLTKKEWSTRVALNFLLRKEKQCFAPYIGVGLGNYYSYNSKASIKRVKAGNNEENIDFDLRKFLRRPGVFATLGMQYCFNERVTFYMQAKSTLLFEDAKSLPIKTEMELSDLINVSTGLRLTIN